MKNNSVNMERISTLILIVVVGSGLVTAQNLVRSRSSGDWRPRARSTICVPRECKLPDCYCAGTTGPAHLRTTQIPQMVMLTFDDAVNERVFPYYQELFETDRRNPNGCPISSTFYVSHNWTNYDMVNEMYKTGHEIASHTITHKMPQSWWTHASLKEWTEEVDGQRDNIAEQVGIPKSKVQGMRAPFLELGGDKQFSMMREKGMLYDASFMTGPYDEGGAWPFTLDFPPNWQYCSNNNCPKSSFPGIWELPMNRWIGPDGKSCPMVDACTTQPLDKEDALGYMWYNFNRSYRGNRAPFGIYLHAVWFRKSEDYFEALETFLDALSDMDDVFLVSGTQVVDWMKNPTPLEDINSFLPWQHSCMMERSLTTGKPDAMTSEFEETTTYEATSPRSTRRTRPVPTSPSPRPTPTQPAAPRRTSTTERQPITTKRSELEPRDHYGYREQDARSADRSFVRFPSNGRDGLFEENSRNINQNNPQRNPNFPYEDSSSNLNRKISIRPSTYPENIKVEIELQNNILEPKQDQPIESKEKKVKEEKSSKSSKSGATDAKARAADQILLDRRNAAGKEITSIMVHLIGFVTAFVFLI